MKRYVALLLTCMLQVRPSQPYEDPIFSGGKYLMSSENTGSNYYLGCGDDMLCSMVGIDNAHEHDGWTAKYISGIQWQFIIRDSTWALDVRGTSQAIGQGQITGNLIYGNPTISTSLTGQLWKLISQSDGTYQLNTWAGALDVDGGVTPFVNLQIGSSHSGQYWYFRSVYPQVTSTYTSTSVVTVNSYASSTVTVTTTICPNKRAYVNGKPLQKRDGTGSAVLDTTTQISTLVVTSTITVSTKTTAITSTQVVTSCAPVTQTQTQVSVSVSKSVATSVATVVNTGGGGGGTGLTAGQPGITNTQPSPSPAKQGAGNAFRPGAVVGFLFLGIALLVPGVVF